MRERAFKITGRSRVARTFTPTGVPEIAPALRRARLRHIRLLHLQAFRLGMERNLDHVSSPMRPRLLRAPHDDRLPLLGPI